MGIRMYLARQPGHQRRIPPPDGQTEEDLLVGTPGTHKLNKTTAQLNVQNLDSGKHSATFIANSSFDLNSAAKNAFSPRIPFSLTIVLILS